MSIGKRIKYLREQRKLSQGAVARTIGIAQQVLNRLENNEKLGTKYIQEFAEFFGVSPAWLQFGDEVVANLIKNDIHSSFYKEWPKMLLTRVPVADWKIAKKGIKAVENINLNTCNYIAIPGIPNPYQFALKIVSADAMQSSMPHLQTFFVNDYLVIDPTQKAVDSKYIIAAIPENEEAIFRQYIVEGSTTYLKPLNTQYDIIKMTDEINICGVIIGKFTNL